MSDDSFARDVKRLGYVPFCVRDAFSWLPHSFTNFGTRKHPRIDWYWMQGGDDVPAKQPCGKRCPDCIFQEPEWSQGHAACAMSWLNDDDGDCRAFISRQEFRAQHGTTFDEICMPMAPTSEEMDPATWARLAQAPYWSDGTPFTTFQPSLNFPSEYYALLNWQEWYENGGGQLYAHTRRERMRRFEQYADDKELQKRGVLQLDLPIEMYVAQQQKRTRPAPEAQPKAKQPARKKLKQLDLF